MILVGKWMWALLTLARVGIDNAPKRHEEKAAGRFFLDSKAITAGRNAKQG
jgi:hypothetical protein